MDPRCVGCLVQNDALNVRKVCELHVDLLTVSAVLIITFLKKDRQLLGYNSIEVILSFCTYPPDSFLIA
jgi:hypothetical protein